MILSLLIVLVSVLLAVLVLIKSIVDAKDAINDYKKRRDNDNRHGF